MFSHRFGRGGGLLAGSSIGKPDFKSDIALLTFVTCVAVLLVGRAYWQDLTIDEAATALSFVLPAKSGEPNHWLTNSNNHVLNSLLMTGSVNLFGSSPLALRLPALTAGIAYLGVAAVLVRIFTSQLLFAVIAFALLAINPLVLDYLAVARGYSIALACEMAAILILTRRMLGTTASRPTMAGVFAGLGLAANYSFLFAFVGLFGCYIGGLRFPGRAPLRRVAGEAWALFWPTATILYVLCFDNIGRAGGGFFMWGATSFRDFWFGIRTTMFLEPNPFVTPPHLMPFFAALSGVAPAIIAAAALLLVVALSSSRCKPGFRRVAIVCSGASAFAAIVYIVLFEAGILHLPLTRTNLPFVPLLTVALIAGIAALESALRPLFVTAMASISLLFLSTVHFWYVSEWKFDADIRSMVQVACDYAKAHGIGEAATTMHFHSASQYYIRTLGCALKTTGSNGGDGVVTLPPDQRIYFVHPTEPGIRTLEGVKVIFTGPVSGAMVAVRE